MVSEFDETFVLDCYKGKELTDLYQETFANKGKAAEYVCICTGIWRNGDAIVATINRAKLSAVELVSIFDGHIAD